MTEESMRSKGEEQRKSRRQSKGEEQEGRKGRKRVETLCCWWCGAIFLHVIVPGSPVVCHSNVTLLHSTLVKKS